MVCASARSAKIFSAVSTTIFPLSSLSATAFPDIALAHVLPAMTPEQGATFFLRSMMGKSHSDDKRCPQGTLWLGHENQLIPHIGDSHFAACYGRWPPTAGR